MFISYMIGIYDLYVDFPQQKITIIGWAEPEKIVKAIKKTRKSAIICSHLEQSNQPSQETEPVPESVTAEAEGGAPPPEQPPPEAALPEIKKEPPLPPENPPPEENQVPEQVNEGSRFSQPSKPNEREEIHVIYHHPPDYGNRYAYGHYHQPVFGGVPPQPVHVTHSYNTYKPLPYVTEYSYVHSPPEYTHYSRPHQYSQVYYTGNNGNDTVSGSGSGNGNITSMFSEENPNACSIV